jgi:hypothetical protein
MSAQKGDRSLMRLRWYHTPRRDPDEQLSFTSMSPTEHSCTGLYAPSMVEADGYSSQLSELLYPGLILRHTGIAMPLFRSIAALSSVPWTR